MELCQQHLCGHIPGCTALTCETASGDHYCGTVGNKCGGSLVCGDDCPTGWTCGTDNICKGAPPLLHTRHMRHSRRRAVLWHGRGRMRGHVGLSDRLSNGGMGV